MKKTGLVIGMTFTVVLLMPQITWAQLGAQNDAMTTDSQELPFDSSAIDEAAKSGASSGGTTAGGNPSTEGTTAGGNPSTDGSTAGGNPPGGTKTTITDTKKIESPLKSKTLTQFLTSVLNVILTFAVPVIVLFIIYGGFQLVIAQGNETKISQAKQTITWAVVGGVIVLAANLILEVIQATVKAL